MACKANKALEFGRGSLNLALVTPREGGFRNNRPGVVIARPFKSFECCEITFSKVYVPCAASGIVLSKLLSNDVALCELPMATLRTSGPWGR